VRVLNRLERVGETLRAALNELATVAPEWLQALAPPDWYERYGRRVENYRLPKTEAARSALAAEIGADGQRLLDAVDAAADRPGLAALPKVAILHQVWAAQYVTEENGRMRLGEAAELPPSAEQICSPYDPDARYSTKREADWVGHTAHTIRTQSTIRLRRALAPRWWAAQWDDVADLQAVLVNDDALHDELQDRLLLGERGLIQPAAHTFAERGQVAQDLLGLGALAA
jgi:hypothetical protein